MTDGGIQTEIPKNQNPPEIFNNVQVVDGGSKISVGVNLANLSTIIDNPKQEINDRQKRRTIEVGSEGEETIKDVLNRIQGISESDKQLTFKTESFPEAAADADRGPEFRAAQAISSGLSFDGTSLSNVPNKIGKDKHIYTGRALTITTISNGLQGDAERVLIIGIGVHHTPSEKQASIGGKPLTKKDGTAFMVSTTIKNNEIVFFWKPKEEALKMIEEYKSEALKQIIKGNDYLSGRVKKLASRENSIPSDLSGKKNPDQNQTQQQDRFNKGKILKFS